MMKANRILGISLILAMIVAACEETNLAITPTATLTFTVSDNGGVPVENARVYLFNTRSTYENYLADNPDGDPGKSPVLNPENIGTTNASGVVVFNDYDLDGPNFASGNTFIFNTNPIYYRVEGNLDGSTYLTNDADENRLDFGEVESGGSATADVDVVLN